MKYILFSLWFTLIYIISYTLTGVLRCASAGTFMKVRTG